jgi:hypothetical protein
MGYRYVNLNPLSNTTGDCAIRACALATNRSWDKTYEEIANLGRMMGLMPDQGAVWGAYLRKHGFYRAIIPNSCPDCFSVKDFAEDHPYGVYVLAINGNPGHVVAVIDGDYLDIWDSGEEIPAFYYYMGG